MKDRLIPFLALSIKKRREQLGMSYEALAHRTGLSAEYLEFIEQGDTNFSMKTLSTVAEALDLPPSLLIEGAEKLLAENPAAEAEES